MPINGRTWGRWTQHRASIESEIISRVDIVRVGLMYLFIFSLKVKLKKGGLNLKFL